MDQVHVIRHKHYNEGQSVRRIAREMGLHRTTVKKYLEETEPKRIEETHNRAVFPSLRNNPFAKRSRT